MSKSENNSRKKTIELRLTIKPTDELFHIFEKIKSDAGIKSNSEVVRYVFKQVSKISISCEGIK